MLLQTQNVTRRFGGEVLFSGVNFEIKKRARIGLVGRNGAGKSTLLKILAEIEAPDEGRVMARKDLTIGFLDQHGGLESDYTIWEEMLQVFKHLLVIEKEMRLAEEKMANAKNLDAEEEATLLDEYHRLQERFERQNGYGYESEMKMILHGFSFFEEDYDKPIQHLSGGQKTRLALAKLLLEKPNLLVLDEPTNHLDIETLSWLENYLMNYSGSLVIVSHDRYFLDKLTTETYEMSHGGINYFRGNYSRYLKEKAKLLEKQARDFDKQQKEIAKMEEFVERNIARASTSRRAQSRRKQLEKIERIDRPDGDERTAFFSFEPERESGNVVMQTDDLAIGYSPEEPLSQGIDIDLRKGDSIALIGPNGIGKSTLLRTIMGYIEPLHGEVSYGSKVDIGYYDQEQEDLTRSKSVLQEVWDDHPLMDEEKIRTFLGSFLFSGQDVEKSIASLSGGERARVSLAKLALNHDNFLVLDEPTNHLDIDSKEVLENALIDFPGTIFFVSHDRYFINRLATKVIDIGPEGTDLYLGDYDYYLQKKEEIYQIELAATETANAKQAASGEKEAHTTDEKNGSWANRREIRSQTRRIEREITRTEKEIAAIEKLLEDITNQMNDLSLKIDQSADGMEAAKELTELSRTFDNKNEQLEELFMNWETFHEELSEYEDLAD